MSTPLPDDDPLNGGFTARAGEACAAKHLQFVFVATAMAGDGVKISFSGSQRCPEVF